MKTLYIHTAIALLISAAFVAPKMVTVKQENITYVTDTKNEGELLRQDFLDSYNPNQHDRNTEIKCLAKNIYFEARGEDKIEQIAVGMVTRNRVMNSSFGTSFCDVVYDAFQFSWTLKPDYQRGIREQAAWNQSLELARKIYDFDLWYDPTEGATHFYANDMKRKPSWANSAIKSIRMDGHTYLQLAQK